MIRNFFFKLYFIFSCNTLVFALERSFTTKIYIKEPVTIPAIIVLLLRALFSTPKQAYYASRYLYKVKGTSIQAINVDLANIHPVYLSLIA